MVLIQMSRKKKRQAGRASGCPKLKIDQVFLYSFNREEMAFSEISTRASYQFYSRILNVIRNLVLLKSFDNI